MGTSRDTGSRETSRLRHTGRQRHRDTETQTEMQTHMAAAATAADATANTMAESKLRGNVVNSPTESMDL